MPKLPRITLKMPSWQGMLWFGVCCGLALLCLALYSVMQAQGKKEGAASVAAGRVVMIDIAHGTLEGGIKRKPLEVMGEAVDVPQTQVKLPEGATKAQAIEPQPGDGLNPAPAQILIEKKGNDLLPITAEDGTRAWRYYARGAAIQSGMPIIAVLVTDLGLNKELTDAALRLPPAVSLAYSPYAEDLGNWATASRAVGHEVFVALPMESAGFPNVDPGPLAMLTRNQPDENMKRLMSVLAKFPGYVGVVAGRGERFTFEKEAAKPVLDELARRGLMAVFGNASRNSNQGQVLEQSTLPFVNADIVIDEEPTPDSITRQLAALETQARERGFALGVASPYPVTLEQLQRWTENLANKGVILVPVSALARMKFS